MPAAPTSPAPGPAAELAIAGAAQAGAARSGSGRWPTQCELCRTWDHSPLCRDCRQRFVRPRLRCIRCALPLAAPAPACGECLRDPPPFDAAVCAVDYGFPWDGLVQAFKFQDRVDLAATLAGLLGAAVRDSLRDTVSDADAAGMPPQLVLPVPLSPQRLQQRGHQQAWGLARALARELGLPARADVLQRAIDTPQQSGLDRAARQRNLRAAFWVPPDAQALVQGRHLALVDDVMTTGATLREAAATLKRAGAASVRVWVFARTP